MTRLGDIPVEELEEALDEATGKRATKRLLAAIIYKRGPSAPMIAEWFGVRPQTIYRWFDRLESEPIEQAVTDRDRPGRPPKLGADERAAFREAVRGPPTAAGYDRTAWTTALARQFLEAEFDTEYSPRHVRRLLREAGLVRRQAEASPAVEDGTATWTVAGEGD